MTAEQKSEVYIVFSKTEQNEIGKDCVRNIKPDGVEGSFKSISACYKCIQNTQYQVKCMWMALSALPEMPLGSVVHPLCQSREVLIEI